MSDTEEIEYEPDHVKHSVGGLGGHIFRRGVHVGLAVVPWLYYWHGDSIAGKVGLTATEFVSAVVLLIFIAEAIRLKIGFTIVGQREYEAFQPSALFWGAIAVGVTLLTAPEYGLAGAAYGLPLICGLTFGDPVMGEMRRYDFSPRSVFIGGTVTALVVWLASAFWLGTPLLIAILMAPLTAASEWPRLKWIDDNATMVLIPLIAVILLSPWF